mgnify:CR=1 FL=1
MSVKRRLKALYKQIPAVPCPENCGQCCGPIAMTKHEEAMIPEDKRKTTDGITCPYYTGGKCEIYKHRPYICRLYGAKEDLPCPKGCKPDKPLGPKETARINAEYQSLIKQSGIAMTMKIQGGNNHDRKEK